MSSLSVFAGVLLTIAGDLLSLLLLSLASLGTMISLWGCAICDNSPPNYVAPIILFALYGVLQWLIFRLIKARWSGKGYRA